MIMMIKIVNKMRKCPSLKSKAKIEIKINMISTARTQG